MINLVLALAMLIAPVVIGGQATDFSGTWRMDFKRSSGLPSSFDKLGWYTLTVEQSSDSMRVVAQFEGGGQKVALPPTIYRFDSSEVYREDTLRGTKRWIRCEWESTGRKLIVTNRVIERRPHGEQHFTETDVWQFGKKNMLLILVTQKFEGNDSTHVERRYFHRMR